MLVGDDFFSLFELFKLFVDAYDFFEVEFLKINVHSPHQKVDEVALLQFFVAKTTQVF